MAQQSAPIITSILENNYGRAPTAAEVSSNEAYFSNGATQEDIYTSNAHTLEEQIDIQSAYQQFDNRQPTATELASAQNSVGPNHSIYQEIASILSESIVPSLQPIAFLDSNDNPVLSFNGTPEVRPIGVNSPHQIMASAYTTNVFNSSQSSGDMSFAGQQDEIWSELQIWQQASNIFNLTSFNPHGAWNTQMAGGTFHPEYTDYSNTMIGAYAAEAGFGLSTILNIASTFKSNTSAYPSGTVMDLAVKGLSLQDAGDIRNGFGLVSSGVLHQ